MVADLESCDLPWSMRSRNCLQTLVCPLELRREDRRLKGRLVFVFGDQAYSIDELAGEVLGVQEAAYFATLRHEIRQSSYLLGRYAVKLALSELFSETRSPSDRSRAGCLRATDSSISPKLGIRCDNQSCGASRGRAWVSGWASDGHRY